MADAPDTSRASLIVLATGTLWGFYWIPVRRLDELGLHGAWGTLAIVFAAVVLLSPIAMTRWRSLASADRWALASVAIGGVSFVFYSVGFVYGRVAIIVLLFYLTPVWSTLISRYVMGSPTPLMRIAAVFVGVAGVGVMLAAGGEVPLPNSVGEWLALASGLLWSIATAGIRVRPKLDPGIYAFVFAAGACVGALVLALLLPAPRTVTIELQGGAAMLVAVATGCLWWGASIAALMWAVARLEPARVGILLMSEVLVSAASAAVISGERLSALELLGGALVVTAAFLELWPSRAKSKGREPTPK